ncbi:MAG: methyltransferase domain-containing protein [Pseudomonadota bacterium]
MYEQKRLTFARGQRKSMDGLMQEQIATFLPSAPVARVLDYGAGNSPYRHVICCEHYLRADLSQNLAGDIDQLIIPGEQLPFAPASFNLILLLDVLEHLADPAFVLRDIKRLLAPQGRLIISVPFLYREHETPHDFARYTAFGIRQLIANQEGTVLRLKKVGNVFYTLLSLFLERGIVNGERNRLGLPGRIVNRVACWLVPLLAPLLHSPASADAGIYHHLLLEVGFS